MTRHEQGRADGAAATESTNATTPGPSPRPRRNRRPLVPFLLGTMVGALAGAVAGTLLSDRTRALLLGLIQLSGREMSEAEREQLRFELLLQ